MAFGNYAPFYRPNYYPMQPMQVPNMQDNAPQFGQPFPQTMQAPQMPVQTSPSNDMIWVLNENEATSYPVAPNNTVTLWDKNLPTIYIKSVDGNGVPSMRTLDFVERSINATKTPQEHVCQCGGKFVSKEAFKELETKFERLTERFDAMSAKTTVKTVKEVENNA